jgi:hypothetical protein
MSLPTAIVQLVHSGFEVDDPRHAGAIRGQADSTRGQQIRRRGPAEIGNLGDGLSLAESVGPFRIVATK